MCWKCEFLFLKKPIVHNKISTLILFLIKHSEHFSNKSVYIYIADLLFTYYKEINI